MLTMKKGYSPIMCQYLKLFKHTRSGSYATRARYKNSCKLFIEFLDEKFKLKNLRNLNNKHVVAYVQHRQEQGISGKTLKNDLAAIRFMHDLIFQAKYELASNDELAEEYEVFLDNTPAVKGDRAWTEEEVINFCKLTEYIAEKTKGLQSQTAKDVGDIIRICKSMGLRIAEVTCMKRSQMEEALRKGQYKVLGEAKNGRHREVPLSPEAKEIFKTRLPKVKRGGLVFVPEGEKAHKVILRYEKFLEKYRDVVTTEEGRKQRTYDGKVNELTFHGLRYMYVQKKIKELMDKGYSYDQSAMIVSKEVGHNRLSVIDVYLGGKKDDYLRKEKWNISSLFKNFD